MTCSTNLRPLFCSFIYLLKLIQEEEGDDNMKW